MKSIIQCILAGCLLLLILLLFNNAYNAIIRSSDVTQRSGAVSRSFRNLSIQINNAAVIHPDLISSGRSVQAGKLFFIDSQSVIKELNFLKSAVHDSINIKIAERLNTNVRAELGWMLNSNVPDSIIQGKAPQHLAALQTIDSLIHAGIGRTDFVLQHQNNQLNRVINGVRQGVICLIILLVILLVYTTHNLLKQQTKRKAREKELEVANRLLKNAQRIGNMGNWQFNSATEEVYWSDEMYNIWGISKDVKITYQDYLKSIHPDDIEKLAKTQGAFFGGENEIDVEYRIVLKDGTIKWVQSKGIHASFKDDKPVASEGILQDITQRKEAEIELNKREKRFSHTLANMLEGVQIIDFDWKYTYVNDALVKYSKYTREELIGFTPMEKYPGIEKTAVFQSMQRCLTEREPCQLDNEFTYPNGSKAHFNLSILPIPEGIFILSVDRTEQKKAEEKLLKANRLYGFLSAINQSIVHISNEQDLFDNACNVAVDIGRFKMAWIDMVDEHSGKLNMVSMRGDSEAVESRIRYSGMDYNNPLLSATPTGKALKTGEFALSNDVQNDQAFAPWKDELVKAGIRSSISFPIKHFGKVSGVFGFHSVVENFFDDAEIALLAEATSDISFALELYEKTRKHNETEELVVRNERRFRSLIEKSSDMKTLASVEGNFLYASPSITSELGYTPEEFLHSSVFGLIHPDEVLLYTEERNRILKTPGASFSFEQRRKHKNGDWIWCEGTLTNMLHEDGVNALVTNFRNISEKKMTDQQREFDRNNLDALINNTNDLMWSVDKKFNLITSNQPFNDSIKLNTGREFENGSNVLSASYSAEQYQRFKNNYERAFNGEAFTEIEYTQTHKSWIEISFYPIRHLGEVIGTACHSRDITDIKTTQENLLQSEKRLKKAEAIAHLGNWELDLATNIAFWSDETCSIYGLTIEENKQPFERFLSFVHPDDLSYVLAVIGESQRRFADNRLNHRIILSSGIIKHIYAESRFEFDHTGNPTGLYGITHDITERKQIELEREVVLKELVKSNADLKQFTFITSHNLRAPLSNIQAILGLVNYADLDTANTTLLNMLDASGKQLTKTVEDLTNILIIRNNVNAETSTISLPAAFNEIYDTFALALEEAGAEVLTDFAVPQIVFNPTYFESILTNLLSNAIKFRSLNRKLVINISSRRDDANNTILKFSDNGIGLELNRYKDRLFGLYQRFHTDINGTGMGLFIVKSQLEALNGKIEVESEPDKGATFIITLPGVV